MASGGARSNTSNYSTKILLKSRGEIKTSSRQNSHKGKRLQHRKGGWVWGGCWWGGWGCWVWGGGGGGVVGGGGCCLGFGWGGWGWVGVFLKDRTLCWWNGRGGKCSSICEVNPSCRKGGRKKERTECGGEARTQGLESSITNSSGA